MTRSTTSLDRSKRTIASCLRQRLLSRGALAWSIGTSPVTKPAAEWRRMRIEPLEQRTLLAVLASGALTAEEA